MSPPLLSVKPWGGTFLPSWSLSWPYPLVAIVSVELQSWCWADVTQAHYDTSCFTVLKSVGPTFLSPTPSLQPQSFSHLSGFPLISGVVLTPLPASPSYCLPSLRNAWLLHCFKIEIHSWRISHMYPVNYNHIPLSISPLEFPNIMPSEPHVLLFLF